MGECKHCCGLALSVRINRINFNAMIRFQQALDDIDGLPDARWDEVLKDSDVVICHMSVTSAAPMAQNTRKKRTRMRQMKLTALANPPLIN